MPPNEFRHFSLRSYKAVLIPVLQHTLSPTCHRKKQEQEEEVEMQKWIGRWWSLRSFLLWLVIWKDTPSVVMASRRGIMDPDLVLPSSSAAKRMKDYHHRHRQKKNPLPRNVTQLDCGMRELALDYAKTLNSDPDTIRHVFDALRLDILCGLSPPPDQILTTKNKIKTGTTIDTSSGLNTTSTTLTTSTNTKRSLQSLPSYCTDPNHICLYVISTNSQRRSRSSSSRPSRDDNDDNEEEEDGTIERPFSTVHDAIQEFRRIRQKSKDKNRTEEETNITIVLGSGIHSLQGRMIELSTDDSGLSIVGIPGESVWLSGGIPIRNVTFDPYPTKGSGLYVANLTSLLNNEYPMPNLISLFSKDRRWIRARYPNSNPETDQWGYASPKRLEYSIPSQYVLEWHLPPKGSPPNFTFMDFQENPPPGIPPKNNSMQRGYNWYASGHGGVCSEIWGSDADSYWCSNASQGGWAEVDQECAMTGQIQLPIGLTYNTSSSLELVRFQRNNSNLLGGIIHAWHSQSWAMHMFEIIQHIPKTGVIQFAKGGGKQGGRNWCRCDQCTYAAGWCGQHQTPSWKDTRLIGGTWMIENILQELDAIGEFYFDMKSKLLYIKPNTTDDLKDLHFALLEQVIVLSGSSNVTIDNIGFRDTVPTYHPKSDWSAPSGGDWSLHRGGAIFIENSSYITIQNCIFRRLDGNAIFLSRWTRNVMIDSNYFEWLGENAIATWGDTNGYDATEEEFPMYTTIQRNVMRELGIYEKQSSAVGQAKAARTSIHNNIMFNMPRAAINFNDMVGGGDTVYDNLIFNTCRESGDHGPINTWDRQPFLTTLRNGGHTPSFDPIPREIYHNFIIANYGASQGIDNDDGSSWYHIHHNLFYSAEGFKMDYGGHDSIFEDNLIMAFPYDGSQCFNMGDFYMGHGDILRRNRCLLGLGNNMGSGCGDPSCARPVPESDESQEIVGTLWGGCDNSAVLLTENHYFTPDGKAKIRCEEEEIPLDVIQSKYGMEIGSSNAKLPDVQTMITWAKELLQHRL